MLPEPSLSREARKLHEDVRRLHADLQAMYKRSGIDRPLPEEIRPERTDFLMRKAHPADCICPEHASARVKEALPWQYLRIPEGTHVLPVPRIGDKARNDALDLLREAFGDGRISDTELDARMAAALKAEMQDDLDYLVKDLLSCPQGEPGISPLRGYSLLYSGLALAVTGMIVSCFISLSTLPGDVAFVGSWGTGLILAFIGWNTRKNN